MVALNALLAAQAIIFLYAIMQPGQIFSAVRKWMWHTPYWIRKPLYDCLTCMTSVWGTVMWFVFGDGSCDPLEFIRFILITGFWLMLADISVTHYKSTRDYDDQEVGEGIDQ